ncbi:hypothetical protein [Pontibacter sp. SGAir0037]|uniref:hypothetical protein n=1 Tax=Pontibacter sp. SGAir0037 TaxID=2571030 RepID=UPI0010CD03C1|nr:hypothetical protein [Pontibacter sp. SGAir0037]QCR22860.1 hypothetical protein C1N53_11235 [Pontibacter sp. SGAir0037]
MKRTKNDVDVIEYKELSGSWPEPFKVNNQEGSYQTHVVDEIPGATTFDLVMPEEDYFGAVTDYIKSNSKAQDINLDILRIYFDPILKLHTVQPLKIAVTFTPASNRFDSSSQADKLIMHFSEFVNNISKANSDLD